MITNEDIERAFLVENVKLNQAINSAQFDFYKPELTRSLKLNRQMLEKQWGTKQENNPLEGANYGNQR